MVTHNHFMSFSVVKKFHQTLKLYSFGKCAFETRACATTGDEVVG